MHMLLVPGNSKRTETLSLLHEHMPRDVDVPSDCPNPLAESPHILADVAL